MGNFLEKAKLKNMALSRKEFSSGSTRALKAMLGWLC